MSHIDLQEAVLSPGPLVTTAASRGIHFAVYRHALVSVDDQTRLEKALIVLRDKDGNILAWTDLDKYCSHSKGKAARAINSENEKRVKTVVRFLNYCFFEKYRVARVTDIVPDMVKDFLNDYGLCRLPGDGPDTRRGLRTVTLCVSNVIDFLDRVVLANPKAKMDVSRLFRTEQVFSKKKRRYVDRKVPVFDVRCNPKDTKIFRDIPDAAFQIIMDRIATHHTNILMLAACGAFAGMRPSECCNVRREDSPLGAGIRFHTAEGEVVDVSIDLREELNLRSDLVSVGGIKKPRIQQVYPAFLHAFLDCYDRYMEYVNGHPYEAGYGALTNTESGKAYTYASYSKEFSKVVRECVPIFFSSDDPELAYYGKLLQEHSLGPHVFRHWFSVQLTLFGEDTAGLMRWRGDKSPESALTYLMDKSDLEKAYGRVSAEFFNYSLWKAGKLYGKGEDR